MTRNLFTPEVRRRVLGAMIVSLVVIASGCRSNKAGQTAGQEAGTSTGLPYRPNGNPTIVELPSGYPIYPTPPAVKRQP